MIALGSSPVTPMLAKTTITIGAIARIGTVWLATAQGITDWSMARLWTIPTASRPWPTQPTLPWRDANQIRPAASGSAEITLSSSTIANGLPTFCAV